MAAVAWVAGLELTSLANLAEPVRPADEATVLMKALPVAFPATPMPDAAAILWIASGGRASKPLG